MADKARLQVMYTVDVEAWPRLPDWRTTGMAGDLARDIDGATPEGNFGVGYQVDLLQQHGLKGVFFIEALMACELGIDPLARIVDTVQAGGSEVQLHIHTEWFEKMSAPLLGSTRAYNIRELEFEAQKRVIERAKSNLEQAGANDVIAYRAGNFGADFRTLRALGECGIRYDSSYNYCYLEKGCGLGLDAMLVQPTHLHGVVEYPVSCYRDYPGHYRPAQLCAISGREMQAAMSAAHREDWQSFVIVSHSFEMLRDRKLALPYGQPDRAVIARFEELCRHLQANQDRYETVGFLDLDPDLVSTPRSPLHPPLLAGAARTALRMASQGLRRLPRQQENALRRGLRRVGLDNF